jgi:thiamine-phosphate pyrophosphorylase
MQRNTTNIHGLYAITPDTEDLALLIRQVEACLKGGAQIIQYRNKSATQSLRHLQASALLKLCQEHNKPLIINDHLDLCLALNADGLHIGGEDGDIASLKSRLKPHQILGVSCYTDFKRAKLAKEAGADYVAFGACFPSSTKPHAPRADLKLFSEIKQLAIPSVAIGGITRQNAQYVIEAGADAIAVIHELFGTDESQIESVANTFSSLFLSS